jgi:hypothetical protein
MIDYAFEGSGSLSRGEGDWVVRQFFSDTDLQMSPEEYAARHAQRWGCFSFHQYRYNDRVLGEWVRQLGEILFTDGEVERCRRQILKPDELAEVLRQEAQEF